jgi:hypothetical protein
MQVLLNPYFLSAAICAGIGFIVVLFGNRYFSTRVSILAGLAGIGIVAIAGVHSLFSTPNALSGGNGQTQSVVLSSASITDQKTRCWLRNSCDSAQSKNFFIRIQCQGTEKQILVRGTKDSSGGSIYLEGIGCFDLDTQKMTPVKGAVVTKDVAHSLFGTDKGPSVKPDTLCPLVPINELFGDSLYFASWQ